jgi:hypothetical protein
VGVRLERRHRTEVNGNAERGGARAVRSSASVIVRVVVLRSAVDRSELALRGRVIHDRLREVVRVTHPVVLALGEVQGDTGIVATLTLELGDLGHRLGAKEVVAGSRFVRIGLRTQLDLRHGQVTRVAEVLEHVARGASRVVHAGLNLNGQTVAGHGDAVGRRTEKTVRDLTGTPNVLGEARKVKLTQGVTDGVESHRLLVLLK